jgi:hypothetical protein
MDQVGDESGTLKGKKKSEERKKKGEEKIVRVSCCNAEVVESSEQGHPYL